MNNDNKNIKSSGEFKTWLQQSKQNNPEFAEYLQRRFTMQQSIGYVIAAMKAEGYFDPVDAGGILLTLIEEQFINLKPEEGGGILLPFCSSIGRTASNRRNVVNRLPTKTAFQSKPFISSSIRFTQKGKLCI